MKALQATVILMIILLHIAAFLWLCVVTNGAAAFILPVMLMWFIIYGEIGGFNK